MMHIYFIQSYQSNVAAPNTLNSLQVWEKPWDMEFHPKKCKVLTITNKKKPFKTFYVIHNECVESAKYLGGILNKT